MVSIQHILCPIDFSDSSRKAFGQAVAVARNFRGKLTALHVMPLHMPPLSGLAMGAATALESDARDRLRSDLAERLRDFVAPLAEGISFDALVEEGNAAGQIAALAHALRVDLVVMGTHGYGGIEKLMLGSTTEKVLHKAPCAVLTIPPATVPEPPSGLFPRILCATDFSESAERALDYAVAFAKRSNGRITLLHVLEPMPAAVGPAPLPAFDVAGYQKALEAEARERLRRFAPAEAEEWCGQRELRVGRAYHEVLRAAESLRADLIAMGARGQSGLADVLFGSTSYHIARRAACPVLTVRVPSA